MFKLALILSLIAVGAAAATAAAEVVEASETVQHACNNGECESCEPVPRGGMDVPGCGVTRETKWYNSKEECETECPRDKVPAECDFKKWDPNDACVGECQCRDIEDNTGIKFNRGRLLDCNCNVVAIAEEVTGEVQVTTASTTLKSDSGEQKIPVAVEESVENVEKI